MNNGEVRRSFVESLRENVDLKGQIADYEDSSQVLIDYARKETDWWNEDEENRYLAEIRDWDLAPISAVSDQLPKTFKLIDANRADDFEIAEKLYELVDLLKSLNHRLIYTDHLSDRLLYKLIVVRVLSVEVKYYEQDPPVCYWDFSWYEENGLTQVDDESVWATFYATENERETWRATHGQERAPLKRTPPFHRDDRAAQRALNFH